MVCAIEVSKGNRYQWATQLKTDLAYTRKRVKIHIIFHNHMNHLIFISIPLVVNTARKPHNNQLVENS